MVGGNVVGNLVGAPVGFVGAMVGDLVIGELEGVAVGGVGGAGAVEGAGTGESVTRTRHTHRKLVLDSHLVEDELVNQPIALEVQLPLLYEYDSLLVDRKSPEVLVAHSLVPVLPKPVASDPEKKLEHPTSAALRVMRRVLLKNWVALSAITNPFGPTI